MTASCYRARDMFEPDDAPSLLGSIATRKYVDVLLGFSAGSSFPGGVRRSRRHEPWRSHASLRGRAAGTHLRARARSYPAGCPASEAASYVDPILNRPLTPSSLADNPSAFDGRGCARP